MTNPTVYTSSRNKPAKKGLASTLKRLIGLYPLTGDIPLEEKDYAEPIIGGDEALPEKSFSPFVPISRFDAKRDQFKSYDNRRCAILEVLPADIEGREESLSDEIATKISTAFQGIPCTDPPFIVQIFINNEPIRSLISEIKDYMKDRGEDNAYRKNWEKVLEEHFSIISQPQGIFTEERSGIPWKAIFRRVRIVIYQEGYQLTGTELNAITMRLVEGLKEAGVTTMRVDDKGLHDWLKPWYTGLKEKAYDDMEENPFQCDSADREEPLPADYDIGISTLGNKLKKADPDNNCWWFGDRPNRFITLDRFRYIPKSALWNKQNKSNGSSPFDRLPDGAVLATTLVFEAQDIVEAGINVVLENSKTDSKDAEQTAKECNEVLHYMAQGFRLLSSITGIYVDAPTLKELDIKTSKAIAAASSHYYVIEPDDDLLSLDTFARCLPMAFSSVRDKKKQKRARKTWESHIARAVPFYGRGRGSGRPGVLFSASDGEPCLFDPLNKVDRVKNAHALFLGPPGSGKTATFLTQLMHQMAVHKPRLFLITALPTFYLFADFCKAQGLTINRIQITAHNVPSLPPFADITKLILEEPHKEVDDMDEEDMERDILGEALIITLLMITGGREEEAKTIKNADKGLIKKSIMLAAQMVVDDDPNRHALTEDIASALRVMSKNNTFSEKQREMLASHASAVDNYTMGIEGELFNRKGEAWPDVDVTIVELGLIARKGYEDSLAISMAGLMSMINNVVEQHQFSDRHTITGVDECHVIMKNHYVAPIMYSMSSMWRTLGGWLWLSTQNLHQFPDSAAQLLAQPEWWYLLNLEADDVEQITRFKKLTPEQKSLLQATTKESGKFTEGVLFSKRFLTLFRNVPPAITLAIAQTEKEEKSARKKLMIEHNCSEIEAAYIIADQINDKRRNYQP